jgi:2-C-methyl-D-erythritol 2,4-cyclodiphosphate synthase
MNDPFGNLRIGFGHDTHRVQAGGPLRLGGIDIDCPLELVGHSDADVLLHAITDSLLGAAGLGDIGELYPDDEPANRNRDSGEMLAAAYRLVTQNGWQLVNLDCVVLAERPKLQPFRERMRTRIADLLHARAEQIGLKGKTGEKTGPIGQGQIMHAMCVSLLRK